MTLRRQMMTAIVLELSLFALARAQAATLSTDMVLGPDHPFPEQTITVIDGVDPPTVITVIEGALVGDVIGGENIQIAFDVFGQSIIRMSGGTLRGAQQAARLHDQSTFYMKDGLVRVGVIETRDSSRAILDGGFWNDVSAYDSSSVQVNGGDDGSIFFVKTFGESHAAINSEHLDFIADESSTMVLNGGFFEIARALGDSEVLVNGGSFIAGFQVSDNATVRMRDLVTMNEENVDVSGNAVVHVYGTNLRFEMSEENRRLVRGTWPDGGNFAFQYRLFDQGQIILHEVPEPTAWSLLAVAATTLACTRRRSNRRRRQLES